MKRIGIAGALGLALLTTAHANEVVIPGSFAVSESGAATYSIDIDVPPGTAGIEPKLSLSYSSQGGNGLLGMGWSLSGLSSITRCPKTLAQDGVRGAVKFDANDRFCLDGQRLVSVSGAYGASGTEYRTEMEGFSRITSNGSAGVGPASFIVETKSGLTMEYGTTADSRVEAQGKSEAMTWTVNRIEDTLGNYMSVSYTEDTANGQHQPLRIDYTGNGSTAPSTSVQFEYQTRHDITPMYHAGSLFKTTQRLTHLKTFVGTSLVSEYRLAYEISSATQRSRLISITKCDEAGSCLPSKVNAWLSGTIGSFSVVTNFGGVTGSYVDYTPHMADFDGDGKSDILWISADIHGRSTGQRYLWFSNGDGSFNVETSFGGVTGSYVDYTPHMADFDGDGKSDILWISADIHGRSTGQRYLWFSNGDGSFNVETSFGGVTGSYVDYTPHMADFDGDGKSDILWISADIHGRSTGQRYLWFSNGDGSFNVETSFGGVTGSYIDYVPRMADFNGDGKSDVLWFAANAHGKATGPKYIWFSDGDGSFSVVSNFGGVTGSYVDYVPRVADFNGDGKSDLYWFSADAYGRATGERYLWLGKGDSSFSVYYNVAGQSGTYDDYLPRMADFNGDGKTDVLWFAANAHGKATGPKYIWFSNGDGSFDVTSSFGGVTGSYVDYVPRVADFSGGGESDILWFSADAYGRGTGERYIWFAGNVPPDLFSSVDDGFGAKVQLSYKPLTDSSVYTKGSGATYPEIDLQVPSYVVSRAEVRDGVGGFVPTEYRYGGLRARADGRGSVGFAWTEAEQVETDFVTRREYRQDYPYVGRVALERTSAPGVGLAGVLSEKTYSFACLNPANGLGCVEAAGNRYFPYASSIVEKGWDLDGSILPTVTTTNTYDSWGNATQIDVVTSDGFSKSTTNTYTNDAVNWILGRLTRTEVTDVSP